MRETSLIQVSPEQLQVEILKQVKAELLQLSKTFQPKLTEEFLTRKEVAKLCKVNISTVSNWKNDGVINAYGLGGRVYYKRSEIEVAMIKIN